KRKAPKGQPGGNDLQFSLRAALLGGIAGFVCSAFFADSTHQNPINHTPAYNYYTRDLPDTADAVGVRGHFRNNGNYVPPHMRSRADGIFENNWSTSGNLNPYTGEAGSRQSP